MKAIIAVATAAAFVSIAAWTTAIPEPAAEERPIEAGSVPPKTFDSTVLVASAGRLRSRNPFRLDRKPADVRYNPWEPAVVTPPSPPPARPPLALAGLLGPPWNALVEGIPGREGGVLLQVGDTAGGVQFVALRGDTVVLAGFDTTWTLTARRAWR